MTTPNQYLIKLYFMNLDENLSTRYQAHMDFPNTYADNFEHAELLAMRLEKTHGADDYKIVRIG